MWLEDTQGTGEYQKETQQQQDTPSAQKRKQQERKKRERNGPSVYRTGNREGKGNRHGGRLRYKKRRKKQKETNNSKQEKEEQERKPMKEGEKPQPNNRREWAGMSTFSFSREEAEKKKRLR